MSSVLIVVIAVVVVLGGVAVAVQRSRSKVDGVDSFRRQIDALSAEARRPVVDQVQNATDADEPPADEPDDDR